MNNSMDATAIIIPVSRPIMFDVLEFLYFPIIFLLFAMCMMMKINIGAEIPLNTAL